MGTGRGRSGSFSLWREGFGGLGHCCGGVLCIFRLLSLKRSLPCAPHPPASLGLRLSRNFSDKVSREPQDPPLPPPPPSPNMRKGLSGKLRARARLCICVCACVPLCKWYVRARRDGRGDSHNEGNRLFSPSPNVPTLRKRVGATPLAFEKRGRS